MLIQLVYLSTSRELLTDEQLTDILLKSQQNNTPLEITGALVYHDGNFIQLLEGPEENVLSVYAKIKKDPRHQNITTLIQAPIQEREFASWSMAFQNVSKLPPEILEKNPVLNTPLTDDELAQRPSRALVILRAFRDNLR